MSNFTEEEYKLMDNYINNTLGDAEKEAFQRRLKAEPALADELEWLKKLELNYAHLKWKEYFEERHHTLITAEDLVTKPTKTFWVQWGQKLALAASVILVLGSGLYFFVIKNNKQEVAQKPNEKHPIIKNDNEPINTGADNTEFIAILDSYAYQLPKDIDSVPTELRKGITAYKTDQTQQAIKLFKEPIYNEVLSPKNEKPEYSSSKGTQVEQEKLKLDTNKEAYRHLYLGLSYLKTNQIDNALSEITKAKIGVTKSSAEWYEALCYLKLKQIDRAKTILESISNNPQNPYEADALEILNALN